MNKNQENIKRLIAISYHQVYYKEIFYKILFKVIYQLLESINKAGRYFEQESFKDKLLKIKQIIEDFNL